MMWELIRQNRKKSYALFVGMAILLVLLGFMIGNVFDPEYGGLIGVVIAVGMWTMMTLVTVSSGDKILLRVSGAREVTKDVHPRLFNVVEEMKIASGLPAMPKIYIIDQQSPNAFAIGLKPEKSAVAVTAGLLARLNRDELQGVIAHEMAHIANRDSQLMTVAGIMLGSIVLLSQIFLRSWWFMPSGGSRGSRRGSGGGGSPQIQMIMIVAAILLAILAPIFARLLYLAISRKREYLADATAVQLTRYPDGLASALEKIGGVNIPLEGANQVTAPMYIINPFRKKKMKLSDWSSTHPPIDRRVKVLRAMAGGADLMTYEKAYAKLSGKSAGLFPKSGLRDNKRIDIREPSSEPEAAKDEKKSIREAMDLMRIINGYAFLACACGLQIKVPPELDEPKITCPRCSRENAIPTAGFETVAAMVGAIAATGASQEVAEPKPDASSAPQILEYTRKGSGWETFACACGRLMQLSPSFEGIQLSCRTCGRVTRIKQ